MRAALLVLLQRLRLPRLGRSGCGLRRSPAGADIRAMDVGAWLSSQLVDPHWVFPALVTVVVWVWLGSLSDPAMEWGMVVFLTVIPGAWFWYLRDGHPTAAWWVLGTPWVLMITVVVGGVVEMTVRERWRERQMRLGRGTADDLRRVLWAGRWGGGARVARHGLPWMVTPAGALSPVTVGYWYGHGLSIELLWMAARAGCTDAAIRAHALGEKDLDWEAVVAAYPNATLWAAAPHCFGDQRCEGCIYRQQQVVSRTEMTG